MFHVFLITAIEGRHYGPKFSNILPFRLFIEEGYTYILQNNHKYSLQTQNYNIQLTIDYLIRVLLHTKQCVRKIEMYGR